MEKKVCVCANQRERESVRSYVCVSEREREGKLSSGQI